MSNRLLLADGDPKSLRVLEVSLRNAGFEVSTAATGAAAWDAIQHDVPAVIIADPELPELDGLALCARVRERAADRNVPFIFLGADKSVEARVRGLQAGADDYLIKPTYVNEVIARVRALVQRRERDKLTSGDAPPETFQGQLRDITVVDLLEILGANRRSGIVHLHGPRGATAAVYFRQGVVIDAEVGRLSGADAIGRLFGWTEGTFEVEWKNIRRPDAIGRPTAELVLEGMKRLDQKSHAATENAARDAVYEVNYQVLADRLAEIPDEVNGILRLFDGSRRLAQVVEDAQIPDADAMTVISRLRDEGIIVEVKPKPAEAPRQAVPRPLAGDGGSGRGAAPGGERESARAAAASGPVGQSFADRMRAGAGGRAVAERSAPGLTAATPASEPPPPPPATTKTDRGFPQIDLLAPPAAGAEGADARYAASRGEANLTLLNGEGEAEPRERPPDRASDDNVIPFPMEGRASAPSREVVETTAEDGGPPPGSSDEMSPEELAALFGSPSPPAASPTEPTSQNDASSGESAAPKTPASMLQTQRGFGLPPPPPRSLNGGELEEPPVEVTSTPLPHRSDGSESTAERAAELVVGEAAAASATPDAAERPGMPAPTAPVRTATGGGGVVTISTVAEATAQYNDRDVSKREALDELGVQGRNRALKVLAAVLAVGAVGAAVAYRFRSLHPTGRGQLTTEVATRTSSPAPPTRAEVPGPIETSPARVPALAAQPENNAATPPPQTVDVKNASAKRPDPKRAAAGAEEIPERLAGETAEKPPARAAESSVAKVREEAAEKKPTDARRSRDGEKGAPASDAFRQQLAECHTLFAKNRFREASTACGAAVQSNPRSADALTMMAHVELNRGHMGRAYDLAQKAIAIYPDQADAYVIIGGVHQDGGRNEQAKTAYQRYLHLAPHGRYAVELRSIVGSL